MTSRAVDLLELGGFVPTAPTKFLRITMQGTFRLTVTEIPKNVTYVERL
jgi:hypothetical protein